MWFEIIYKLCEFVAGIHICVEVMWVDIWSKDNIEPAIQSKC